MSKKGKVLYVGYFTTKDMIESFNVFHNVAATTRMKDVCKALSLGGISVDILSPLFTRKIVNKKIEAKAIDFEFARLISIAKKSKGIIGTLTYIINVFFWIFREVRNYDAVIIYNFNVPLMFVGMTVKARRKRLILDWEDWSRVRVRDIFNSQESNFIFQLYMSLSQNVIIALSDAIFGPKNFTNSKKHKTITGILFEPYRIKARRTNKTEILVSGKLTKEHGIHILKDLIREYSLELKQMGVLFTVVGYSDHNAQFLKNSDIVNYRGFVTEKEYRNLTDTILFALVLQDPEGRFKGEKIPSKLYRYLDNNMRVLSTNFDEDIAPELDGLVDFFTTTEELFESICHYCIISDNQMDIEAKNKRKYFEANLVASTLKEIIHV